MLLFKKIYKDKFKFKIRIAGIITNFNFNLIK